MNTTKYFQYLDILRESGVTNMFGAGSYLTAEFDLSKGDARNVLMAWMQTYNLDSSLEERAQQAEALGLV